MHPAEILPQRSSCLSNRGNIWKREGEYDKAFEDLNEAIRLNSNHENTWHRQCLSWAGKGERDKAPADLEKMFRLDPHNQQAVRNRAVALLRKCPRKMRGGFAIRQGIGIDGRSASRACEGHASLFLAKQLAFIVSLPFLMAFRKPARISQLACAILSPRGLGRKTSRC